MLSKVTPLILAFNEEPNIGRCLARLSWAETVVVVDSGSTDGTEAICRAAGNVRFVVHPFASHAEQWTFALRETGIATEWVLALDADYVLQDGFADEVATKIGEEGVAAYQCRFTYVSLGRRLRATLYPPVTALFRRECGRYVQDGHTQRLVVDGKVGRIDCPILHDDRKPLSRWFWSQQRYAVLEARHLSSRPPAALSRNDRIRLMAWPAPVLVLLYVLFVKRCALDGWPGWFYALQRLLAETMLALELIDRRLGRTHDLNGSA